MINLTDICGIPIFLDQESSELHYDEEVSCNLQTQVDIREISPVLLNKSLKYPERVYKQYVVQHADEQEENNLYDIFQLPSGLLGIEYIKTHVYKMDEQLNSCSCVVEVSKGELMIVIQENNNNEGSYNTTEVKDFKIIELSAGDRIAIPSGVLFTFINAGSQEVVFVVISNVLEPLKLFTDFLVKERGLAYFIISKNARMEIVANPKYKIQKPLERYAWKTMPIAEKKNFSEIELTYKSSNKNFPELTPVPA